MRPSRALRPNVVLVVLDSVRKDHLSCYGYERKTSPNLDRLASEAVLFEQAYSTSCWTIPAHASLFTGLYPFRHGANDLRAACLGGRSTTLASFVRERGYRTASISCNGFIASTDLDAGFDESVDVGRLFGGPKGPLPRIVRAAHRSLRNRVEMDRGAKRATWLAMKWLADQDAERPFFLFMNYMDCHLPYRLRGPARYRFVPAEARDRVDAVSPDPFAVMAGESSITEDELKDLKALYDGALHYLDRQIGALVDRLKGLGLYDTTMLIVTSDHGESFGEHGLMDHQYGLWEHLISVPLIWRLPERQGSAERRAAPVQLVDILPTIAGMLGEDTAGPERRPWDGRDVFGAATRESILAEYLVPNLRAIRRRYPGADTQRYDIALRSLRVDRHKLIARSDGRAALFDLANDPEERRDLATLERTTASQMQARLVQIAGDWPTPENGSESRDLEAVRERLKALGYI